MIRARRTRSDVVVLILLVFIVGVYFAGINHLRQVRAVPIDQYHSGWQLIEARAAEDAANFATALPLATNKGNWANKTSEAFRIASFQAGYGAHEGYSAGTQWMFAFFGTDAADDTFSFNLVGWAKRNGMAQIICEGNGILGTQDVVVEPNGTSITAFWADTIVLDETTKWPRQRGMSDPNGVAVYNSDDNEVCLLVVDLAGIEWIDFVTYEVAGSAECATLGVYGRRW